MDENSILVLVILDFIQHPALELRRGMGVGG